MSWLLNRHKQEETGIPADLVASIESADIMFRPSVDETGAPRVMVRAVGLGAFHYEGKREAAERIARMCGLPAATARRAAGLLAQVVAHRNREAGQTRRARKPCSSYVRAAYRDIPEFMR